MSNYFSSILFQMFKWFSFFFLFIAILVCRTWFLKKLRLCRRAATLARCDFVLLLEGSFYLVQQVVSVISFVLSICTGGFHKVISVQ